MKLILKKMTCHPSFGHQRVCSSRRWLSGLSRAPLTTTITSGNRSPSTPPGEGWCPPSPLGLLDILVFLKASGQTGTKKLFMGLATSVCLSRASLVKVTPTHTPASLWFKFHNQKGKADFAIVQSAVLSMLSPGMGRRECLGSIMTEGR